MNKEILRLAVPNIISNISVPLLSTVDTALMGHLSAAHLGAVGLSSMIFNFIYWNFGFLRMGTTGLTAQSYGKQSAPEIAEILQRTALLSVAIAAVLLIFQRPILSASLYLLNVSGDQVALVSEYYNIRIWAAPASLLLFSLIGWFFGMQNAFFPLVVTLAVNAVNIGLSFYFVVGLDMGIRGVALSTLLAQYLGLATALVIIIWRYRQYIRKSMGLGLERMGAFFRVNGDLFVRTVSLTFAFAFFYSRSSESGPLVLAANVVLLQFIHWMSYGIDGFAFASESLVGKYVGALDRSSVFRAIRYSFYWGIGVAVGYSFLFGLAGNWIMHLFTNDLEVLNLTMQSEAWLVVLPLAAFGCYIWDGIFIGLTATAAMRNTMLAALLVYLGTYYAVAPYSSLAIWISLIVFLFIRGLFQTLVYYLVLKPRSVDKWNK